MSLLVSLIIYSRFLYLDFLKSSAQLIVLVCIVQYFVVFNWYRQSAKKGTNIR